MGQPRRVLEWPVRVMQTSGRRSKTRHYRFTEVTQLVTGQRQDALMERHIVNCKVCLAHAIRATEIQKAAKKATEES